MSFGVPLFGGKQMLAPVSMGCDRFALCPSILQYDRVLFALLRILKIFGRMDT